MTRDEMFEKMCDLIEAMRQLGPALLMSYETELLLHLENVLDTETAHLEGLLAAD